MSARVSFTDLLKKGAEKDKQKVLDKPSNKIEINHQPTPPTTDTIPTPPTEPTTATTLTPPTPSTEHPISPQRDFAKVANSIVREAVAQGLFIGKSKQIYDFLYLQTRGAIQPKRSARITKSKLMRGADIGSERTLLKNLSHLKSVGLIKVKEFDGQHGGNEYEVFLPEETHRTSPTPPTADQPHYSPQKVGTVPPVESNVSGVGQTIDNTIVYGDTNTSFKDNNKSDDETARVHEAFTRMTQKLNIAVKKITGKNTSKHEAEKWENLADLLVLELEIAASRSNGISSVPAFLTEILRRQFFNSRQPSAKVAKSATRKIDTAGRADAGSYEIKPLNAKEREAALAQVQEFADDEFLNDFKKWYTAEDWEWLIKQLGNNQEKS